MVTLCYYGSVCKIFTIDVDYSVKLFTVCTWLHAAQLTLCFYRNFECYQRSICIYINLNLKGSMVSLITFRFGFTSSGKPRQENMDTFHDNCLTDHFTSTKYCIRQRAFCSEPLLSWRQ